MTGKTINMAIDALQIVYKQIAKKAEREEDQDKRQMLKEQMKAYKQAELDLYVEQTRDQK